MILLTLENVLRYVEMNVMKNLEAEHRVHSTHKAINVQHTLVDGMVCWALLSIQEGRYELFR